MHRLRSRSLILLSLLALLLPQGRAAARDFTLEDALSDAGVRVSLADGRDEPTATALGLFIGINRYPLMPGWDLGGCVADAWALHAIFTQRFGIERAALLTNAQATRQAISEEFAAMVRHVERLRDTPGAGRDDPVTVVIAFAGHGRRVVDLAGDEDDGLDETWVAADSDLDASQDIRDDELHLVYRRLAALGAQTIILSDSCHSGSMHRQSVRVRAIHHATPPRGPQDDRFAQFGARTTRGSSLQDGPLPGLIFYAACHQAQKASEHVDDLGQPCGRFTLALRTALGRVGSETTYGEVFDHVRREFDRLWPGDGSQTPQFHADPLKVGERFLRGGHSVRHATIVPRSLTEAPGGATMRLSMGSLDGVSVGAHFRLFRTLDDLAAARDGVATVRVAEVGPLTSVAQWSGTWSECPITIHDKASLDSARWRDFTVALGPNLPVAVIDRFRGMAAAEQIGLSVDGVPAPDVAVHRVAKSAAIGLYRAGAEPSYDAPSDADARPLIALESVDGDGASLALALAEQVLHLARMHRLMSLETIGSRGIDPVVRPQRRDAGGSLVDVDRPAVDGVLRLHEGDLFTIRIANPLETTMHVTVIALDAESRLQLLYPLQESDTATARRGRTLDLATANPFIAQRSTTAGAEPQRARIKVIVTASPLDLSALTFRPTPERHGVRQRRSDGSAAPTLFNLLSDLAFGGPGTRTRSVAVEEPWAVGTVVLDIVAGADR